MAVRANPEQLDIDTSGCRDCRLISTTFRVKVGGSTVQEANVVGGNRDGREQLFVHDSPEAAGTCRIDTDELVQVERSDLRKVQVSGSVLSPQLRVHRQRRPASRQPEHKVRLPPNRRADGTGGSARGAVDVVMNVNDHLRQRYAGIATSPA